VRPLRPRSGRRCVHGGGRRGPDDGAPRRTFYAELLERLDLEDEERLPQLDRASWPEWKERFAALFATKTRDAWCEILEGTDACFAPVLSMSEAREHPHNRALGTFVEVEGVVQPHPTPRFGRTPTRIQRPPARVGEHTHEALLDWGVPRERVAALREARVVG
jgi:alpha-methylacyl-CoA racemase